MAGPSASTSGQSDLGILLKTMSPVLRDEEYVFCSIPEDGLRSLSEAPIGVFQEEEGTTLIMTVKQAERLNLPITVRWRMITLSVHSDLQAIGFLAVITTALARASISVNAISAFYHDHLFVPSERAQAAMDCLLALSSQSASEQ
jgi:hypothetical protein